MRPVLKLLENGQGHFDIRNLGAHIAGPDGKQEFDLLIQAKDGSLIISISRVTLSDLFVRFDPTGRHYSEGIYFVTNFIKSSGSSAKLLEVRKHVLGFIKRANASDQVVTNKLVIFRCSETDQVAIMPVAAKKTA